MNGAGEGQSAAGGAAGRSAAAVKGSRLIRSMRAVWFPVLQQEHALGPS